jgi:RNA polymerase sigma-70 factor (ECF subfamily)
MRPEITLATDLLRRNTPEAVEEAIGLLQNTVYSFSMKVCGHPEDAEDTMQEVLYRSMGYLTKVLEPQALAVWLYTVTRNRCWRMRRKGAYAPTHTVSLDELMPDDAELGRLLQDSGQGPEGDLLQSERAGLLHQAVLRVPPVLRMVLVLHDMEELTTEQVAQILGLKPGTVRVRLHRAHLWVRKEMSGEADGAASAGSAPTQAAIQETKTKGRKRPAACRELFSNLSEYLDDRVAPATCEQMRQHIESCPACVSFLRDLRSAIDRCRDLEVSCDPKVTARLRVILTSEYLRMLGMGSAGSEREKIGARV